MEVKASMHTRSKSEPLERKSEEDKSINISEVSPRLKLDMGEPKNNDETKEGQSQKDKVQQSLKQEVLSLQKRLKDQFMVRRVLEKSLSGCSFFHDATNENPILKPAEDLIKEIAVLEIEVVYLERYLLSLYRNRFNQVPSLSTMDGKLQSTSVQCQEVFSEVSGHDTISKKYSGHDTISKKYSVLPPRNSNDSPAKEYDAIWGEQKLTDSSIYRCHSTLSQRSIRTPPMGIVADAVDSYHSLPLSMLERAQDATSRVSTLAEHLDSCISEHVWEKPNRLSEEMIKSISAIYCKLADPGLINRDYCSSPVSFSSSMNQMGDMWSPECKKHASFDSNSGNLFQTEGSKEFSGPYCTMVEVQWVCRDSKKLRDTEPMLQNFRSLISRLKEVDPRKMKHAEKLAFWINVHNALVMHAFLVYGIPQNNLKRMSLVLKAAYNVGGQNVSVDMIQRSILGCQLPQPGQWLKMLFSSKTKFKVGDPRRLFAIEQREPLLHFALTSGSYSDPAVRMYTSKRVFQELEAAKEEYIEMNLRLHKSQKIVLPKTVDSYARDSNMCPDGLVKMIEHFMPDSARKRIRQCKYGRVWKSIEWVPHNFAFRYLFSRELAN